MTRKQLEAIADRLRANQTETERLFSTRLIRAGWQFEEQFVIGCYVVDFLIPASMQIIEIDGSVHFRKFRLAKDKRRANWLQDLGFRIKRIPSWQVASYPLRKVRAKGRKKSDKQFETAMKLAEDRSAEYFNRGEQRAFIRQADQFAKKERELKPRLIKQQRENL